MVSRTQKAAALLVRLINPLVLGDRKAFQEALASRTWERPALTVALVAVVWSLPTVPTPEREEDLEHAWSLLLAAGARWPVRPFVGRWMLALDVLRPDFAHGALTTVHPLPWLLQNRPPSRLRTQITGRLLNWGHPPEVRGGQGWELLEMAAAQGDVSVGRLLLWAGSPTTARAVAVATTEDMVNLLLDAGATTTTPIPSPSPRLDGAPAVVWLSARPETALALRQVLARAGATALAASAARVEAHARTDRSAWAMSPWAMAVRSRNREGAEELLRAHVPWVGPQDGHSNTLFHLLLQPFALAQTTLETAHETWRWVRPLLENTPRALWSARNASGETWRESARALVLSAPAGPPREALSWLVEQMAACTAS